MKTIFAYTQTGDRPYPGFINLAKHDNDQHVTLLVRTPGDWGVRMSSVPVPDAQLRELAQEINEYLAAKGV